MRVLLGVNQGVGASHLVRAFREAGHLVETCSTEPALLELALRGDWDTLVLERDPSCEYAMSLCAELRESGEERAILLFGDWAATGALVAALRHGADDVLARPFDVGELVARSEAVARRSTRMPRKLVVGAIQIHEHDRSAYVDGTPLALTLREWTLLRFLAQRTGQTVTRAQILAGVWAMKSDPGTNIIDVHMAHLRRKLGSHGGSIRCVRGVGFCLEEPQSEGGPGVQPEASGSTSGVMLAVRDSEREPRRASG